MTGAERRRKIITMLKESPTPLSGGALGDATGVSRQVIVQDIALLRTEGYDIVSTVRGYITDTPNQAVRKIKVCHSNEEIEEELTTIVDLGGNIIDVMVNHKVYGKITADMNIRNRRDIQKFIENIKAGKSSPLLNITSGYHYHHISAETEDVLNEIEEALRKKNFLAETAPPLK